MISLHRQMNCGNLPKAQPVCFYRFFASRGNEKSKDNKNLLVNLPHIYLVEKYSIFQRLAFRKSGSQNQALSALSNLKSMALDKRLFIVELIRLLPNWHTVFYSLFRIGGRKMGRSNTCKLTFINSLIYHYT